MTTDLDVIQPIIEVAAAGNAVLGIRGSGKTYTATYMAERMIEENIPIIAFDPIGVWRHLRTPREEGGAAYTVVIAGGEHGDMPLSVETAPAIVRAAMAHGISLVLDLYSIDLSKADWRKIVTASLSVMLHENKRMGLRHVFIEEAAEFVPQKVWDGVVYAEVEKLARMGGNAKLGFTLINQRAEEVNKAVLELCDNLFLHRQKGRHSLTALSKWLDVGGATGAREVMARIVSLPPGHCFAWRAGREDVVEWTVPEKRTWHPVRTDLRGHETAEPTAVRADRQVGLILAASGIAADAMKSGSKAPAPPDEEALATARDQGRREGWAEAWRRAGFEFGEIMSKIASKPWTDTVIAMIDAGPQMPPEAANEEGVGPAEVVITTTGGRDSAPVTVKVFTPVGAPLTKGEQHVLGALAMWAEARRDPPTRVMVALAAGYSPTSGTFGGTLAKLRARGAISYPKPSEIALTGEIAVPAVRAAQAAARIRAALSSAGNRICNHMVATTTAVRREDLAEIIGMSATSGSYGAVLAALREFDIIRYPMPGIVAMTDWARKILEADFHEVA